MILTREILNQGRSNNGGFGKKQLLLLGIEHPPPNGWVHKVIGQEYDEEVIEKFVALKNAHFKKHKYYVPRPRNRDIDKIMDYAIWKDKD